LSLIKVCGIGFAFLGVFLMAYSKVEKTNAKSYTWMLFVLFVGSALLDVVLNYVQEYELKYLKSSIFCAIGFGIAGFFGLLVIAYQVFKGQQKINLKSVVSGVLLGIPNYFSIYFF